MTDMDVSQISNLIPIGQVAVFYVPIIKLEDLSFGTEDRNPRMMFEKFFMDHYNAYTLELSKTLGFWRKCHKSQIFQDENARYEVSFDGKDRISEFIDFLSYMCYLLKEEAIYLTMGYKSFLVYPSRTPYEV